MKVDLDQAEQILRDLGLEVLRGKHSLSGYDYEADTVVMVRDTMTTGLADGVSRVAPEMRDLAEKLNWLASICERIDRECRVADPAEGEPVPLHDTEGP